MSELRRGIKLVSELAAVEDCWLTFPTEPPWFIHAESDKLGPMQVKGSDLFECLSQIRTVAEQIGYRLACNGSRIDVWPSGMARDMAGARMAYLLSPGRKELVDIFDGAPFDKLATIEEQKERYQKLLRGAT